MGLATANLSNFEEAIKTFGPNTASLLDKASIRK